MLSVLSHARRHGGAGARDDNGDADDKPPPLREDDDEEAEERATAEAISLGVDPRLVLSGQFMQNSNYNRHARSLPELEKRVRLLSAEYRELQKARPIDVVPVAQN